ncbi:sigma-54-dependent Fis family transcriptional regulator [Ramlibacter sp. WS9]|uniref:sigma-54-dependent Fis family transcriptional regulator n=1 Tax=Ramlibacter sp. WS9 TaxID=1882741 RepID=UPI001144E565|nr:sigma-54-dependent Fis family transcriptional regulator [Ramlibacter sp. WS9]ROZ66085.1 sigma-54-dependent Fis family transcriptional regulator [Ramlibacter sp. WS9]
MITTSDRYVPDRVWQARRSFFDENVPPVGLIEESLLRSWQRCRGQGRQVTDRVEFDPVARASLSHLLDTHHTLLEAARPELDALGSAVSDAGYAVLLTDAHGRALAVDGRIDRRSEPLRLAFRPGVDLSEASIGTNAMSSAIAEQRPMRVLGPEHFFADNQIFHCCAAPVFDPQGRVIAAVDVSRDMPGLAAGALALTQRCATRIEHRLFDALPAFLRLSLETQDTGDEARLAFDNDGGLLAANLAARRLIGISVISQGLRFTDLFDGRFNAFAAPMNAASSELKLRLHGGVLLRAKAAVAPRIVRPGLKPPSSTPPSRAAAQPATAPVFGDAAFAARFERALRAFNADLPLLVTGETGVGKEVAARTLHDLGNRRDGPLVALNCGAIAPQLMAAELFGHVEGAFTGARRGGSVGKVESAQGGTLLLDEIGDMPLDLQVGLLRVFDSGEVVRVGATQAAKVDVRFVCATHRDLRELVKEGRFREDLYYRLSGFALEVPPLRARSDFGAVLEALLAEAACESRRLGTELRCFLKKRPWPGNVRQLRHALRLALALADVDEPLGRHHFQFEESGPPPASGGIRAEADGEELSLERAQQAAIAAALQRTGGNVTAAAALLGMGRSTLYRKLGK